MTAEPNAATGEAAAGQATATAAAAAEHDELMALAARLSAEGEHPAQPCPDPVNAAMIRNWTQAVGDTDSAWETEAPPAMLQVWSMPGLGRPRGGSVADEPLRLLDAAGFTGVVATNCEQTYDRYLRHGEWPRSTLRFGGITGPKRTALGEGYFVTWHQTWYVGEERIGEMLFRVLKFRPREHARGPGRAATGGAGAGPPRPAEGHDTSFFWAGARAGELRIQRCGACGALRHPPGPMCPRCHAVAREHVAASGRGTVYSYVVHHHPPVPGREAPFVVGLIELEEGVRMVGNVIGCAPADVHIGMPVHVTFERVDDDLTLPQWTPHPPPARQAAQDRPHDRDRPHAQDRPHDREPAPDGPPALSIELTPTFVIATALATRDFTPLHHDPELARAQGSRDIFLNILTTMGLVQRYVTETVPGAVLAGIAVRLGVPAYAKDTLTLTGRFVDATTMEIRGAVSLGDHVTATVRLREAP
ncbi:MAG TPA: OB-fold domain-containing protein [Streptosporangiaceae bacterium]|nr:OB-fold domain-containing protein [Streptosporangiaceae bacterium]